MKNKKIEFRTFTAGEQKTLLLAKESDSLEDQIKALKDIVKQCTFDQVDVNQLAFFDLEKLFMKIRSKSVSNETTISFKVKNSKDKITKTIDLDDVDLMIADDHSNIVNLTDSIGIVFNYPSLETMYKSEKNSVDLVSVCVESIYDGETVTTRADMSDTELQEFLDSLDVTALKKIKHFFDTMPRLRHELKIKYIIDGEEKEETIFIEGLNDFFD